MKSKEISDAENKYLEALAHAEYIFHKTKNYPDSKRSVTALKAWSMLNDALFNLVSLMDSAQ